VLGILAHQAEIKFMVMGSYSSEIALLRY
jgi:hypothetical protein